MKINVIALIKILIPLLLLSSEDICYSQNIAGKENDLIVRNYREHILISTDRDIYITGEQVWFKIYMTDALTNTFSDLSRIIYIELLDDSDIPVVQLKIDTDKGSGFSRFRLPDGLASGNYILRAYTAWMQNFSPDQFSYKTISVINPFKDIDRLIISPPIRAVDTSLFPGGKGPMVMESLIGMEVKPSIIIRAVPDKNNYGTREKVNIEISVSDAAGKHDLTNLSVSVVKSFLINRDRNIFPEEIKADGKSISGYASPYHLPEPEGQLIRGVIKDKISNEPLRNTEISLSYVGKSSLCQFGKTNENGEFIFVVKELYGLNELVIQPVIQTGLTTTVELDQPFCSIFSEVKRPGFLPDSSLINDINKAIIAMQITAIYEPFRLANKEKNESRVRTTFYGKPTRSVNLDDYIELKDIREVVKEILTEVVLERRNKEYIMKVLSANPYEEFKNQALIIIDGVPFYDIEKLLNVKATEVERVDIVNNRYFYSGYIFEGIISFVTKKGNLSSLEFDDSIYRRVFEGCQPPAVFYSPDYTGKAASESRIPDFRNTLYWSPEVGLSADGNATVGFFTSDEAGEYAIIVEGIDSEGTPGFIAVPFQVK